MIKFLIYNIILVVTLSANEVLIAQKQNTLYVQNLIETEEKIARNFEKYLLNELSIPSITVLLTNEYLGDNFSIANKMGENLDFFSNNELKLKYAVSKKEYIKQKENMQEKNYLIQLYNRELYRDYTTVYYEENEEKEVNLNKSYVEFKLKTPEAKNIYKILIKTNKAIEKKCPSVSTLEYYCNYDDRYIRWYNASGNWIEYNKKDLENGNVTISDISVKNEKKIEELKLGSYIFVIDGSTFIKANDNKVLKVN